MTINGQNISKSVNGWVVDGIQAYLGRDGLTLITGSGKTLAVLTEADIATLRADNDAARVARTAQASRAAKERAHDLCYNEGGEGYNPYRHGSAKTYRR